ncbi:hypothetical protein PPERSA_12286 [Pseudocohnilembus persalinus]|uniref:Uncharacterized protein n=1 Tax=Pseudocohnilembus persalinus TaxID=266149 RepID=A0A0V0R501_PSEPJ|nr:hypothetical protein PPERSA_12286 [Pseudocohnilembus persalinus]|eukprot:KRX09543.1 hypothetical protein PPERSA_12286 [Pseudocohnilembus persalinus]
MTEQADKNQTQEISTEQQQIKEQIGQARENQREESRSQQVQDTLQQKREQLLNDKQNLEENKENQQSQKNKENDEDEDKQENEGISFDEIQTPLKNLINELGTNFEKIKQACKDNKFVQEGQIEESFQEKILKAAESQDIQQYFEIILQRANPLISEMFANMEKQQGVKVELPTTIEEFNQICWQDLTAPIDNEADEDEDEDEEEQEEENQNQNEEKQE